MTTEAPARATTLPAGTWTSDLTHSYIGFSARHNVVSTFRGELPKFDVTLEDGVLSGTAPVSAITTRDENLTGHLYSPEFFDAERYPEVSYRSTGSRFEDGRLVVDGELTIKGITKPITLTGAVTEPAGDAWGGERVGIELEGEFDRRDFDMKWQMEIPGGGLVLGYTVKVTTVLELSKQG